MDRFLVVMMMVPSNRVSQKTSSRFQVLDILGSLLYVTVHHTVFFWALCNVYPN